MQSWRSIPALDAITEIGLRYLWNRTLDDSAALPALGSQILVSAIRHPFHALDTDPFFVANPGQICCQSELWDTKLGKGMFFAL